MAKTCDLRATVPTHNARLGAGFGGFPSRRRFGGGAISMNSNDPGDTLFNAPAISAIFGRMLGQMFDPRTTIEIFRRAKFCWY
jgi:hypothetical protein